MTDLPRGILSPWARYASPEFYVTGLVRLRAMSTLPNWRFAFEIALSVLCLKLTQRSQDSRPILLARLVASFNHFRDDRFALANGIEAVCNQQAFCNKPQIFGPNHWFKSKLRAPSLWIQYSMRNERRVNGAAAAWGIRINSRSPPQPLRFER